MLGSCIKHVLNRKYLTFIPIVLFTLKLEARGHVNYIILMIYRYRIVNSIIVISVVIVNKEVVIL